MQALLGKNYNSFLLTILSTTVGFYCNGYGKFKIFDYHGRDSYGMSHPQGTCVLLEVNTLNELIKIFKVFIKIQMFYQQIGINHLVLQENKIFCLAE